MCGTDVRASKYSKATALLARPKMEQAEFRENAVPEIKAISFEDNETLTLL